MSKAELSAKALLECFFSENERHFRFLEQRYGYNFFCGLSEYRKNYKIIKPFRNQEAEGTFQAITRYEKNDRAIEILYDSDQFLIEGYIYYTPIDRFAFFEILTAAKKPDPNITGDWGLTNDVLITQTVQNMAKSLEKHSHIILDPSARLLERAMTIRHTRLEQSLRQRHTNDLKDVCQKAAKAFREKNYQNVVKLLEPYKHDLKNADLKKLDRAKKSLMPS